VKNERDQEGWDGDELIFGDNKEVNGCNKNQMALKFPIAEGLFVYPQKIYSWWNIYKEKRGIYFNCYSSICTMMCVFYLARRM
jgi:hypothetical protein